MSSLGLSLDHASLHVPNLDAALGVLGQLGLSATRTEGTTHHSRVHFERAYLEVSAPLQRPVPGARIPLFFLGAPGVVSLLPEIQARGVAVQQVGEFEGADGVWDDVVLGAADPMVPAPVLVSRKSPPAVAKDWPPSLPFDHPNGAHTLASVLLVTPAFPEAVRFYESLGGVAEREHDLPAFAAVRRRIRFSNGRIDLLKAARKGRVADWLKTRGPGVMGVSLGVRSLPAMVQRLTEAGMDAYAGDGELFTDSPFGKDALLAFEQL